jgi:NAD(P)-dependent dehydrogenase (short-subunit alcohol dehydrogenase family)
MEDSALSDPVCLITGVGPGTGSALARRFAQGYRVALLARNEERLAALEGELDGARAFPCDVSDVGQLTETFAKLQTELGSPSVVIHNAVGGAFGDFLNIDPQVLERNFQINTMGLFHCGQLAAADMLASGAGSIVITGNTSARRGKARFAGFAPTKAAQRILGESMARSLGPKGIHVSYLVIDAVIDLEWTRKSWPDAPDEYFAKPGDIAESVWQLAHQPKSTWTFETEIRPFGENW